MALQESLGKSAHSKGSQGPAWHGLAKELDLDVALAGQGLPPGALGAPSCSGESTGAMALSWGLSDCSPV